MTSLDGGPQPASVHEAPGLAVRDLGVGYGGAEVVRCPRLDAEPGRITAIVGPNGGGKSTLLKGIIGLLTPSRGTALLDGRPVAEQLRAVAFMPQRAALDWDFPAQVRDVVAMGRYPHRGLRRRTREDHEIIARSLEEVGLADLATHPIRHLSGGQQQRLLLARALAQQGRAVLLDEPLDGVDLTSEQLILDLLGRAAQRGTVIVLVHHDLTTVRQVAHHVVVISGTVVAAGPPSRALSPGVIEQAYTGASSRSQPHASPAPEASEPAARTPGVPR